MASNSTVHLKGESPKEEMLPGSKEDNAVITMMMVARATRTEVSDIPGTRLYLHYFILSPQKLHDIYY